MAVSSAKTWGEDAVEDYHSEFCHGIYPGCTFEAFYSFAVIDLVKKTEKVFCYALYFDDLHCLRSNLAFQ